MGRVVDFGSRAGRFVAMITVASWLGLAAAQTPYPPDGFDLAGYLKGNPAVDGTIIKGTFFGPEGSDFVFWEEGQDLEVPTQPTCLAHELSTPGQGAYISGSGAYISGSVGGLVLGAVELPNAGGGTMTIDSYPVADFLPTSASQSPYQASGNELLRDLLARLPAGDQAVVILVADDFERGIYEVPEALFSLDSQKVSALDTAYATANPSDPLPPESRPLRAVLAEYPVSHGALVLHHLNALIAATEQYELTSDKPVEGNYVWSSLSSGSQLIVRALDLSAAAEAEDGARFARIESENIAAAVATAIRRLDPDHTAVIVNMSWVLLPCATVEGFIAAKAEFSTMREYLAALELANAGFTELGTGDEFNRNALQLLAAAGMTDPLFGLANLSPANAALIFVAASGNFGMTYQMLPAGWPFVLGVGSPRDDRPPPPFANASEVSAPGAWFKLQPWRPGQTTGSETLSYAGTSFSSPLLALFLAVDVAANGDCVPGSTGVVVSELASEPPAESQLGAPGTTVNGTCRSVP